MADDSVCSIQNVLCRTVILFQFDDCGIFKVLLKIQNIFDICPTELINRLVIITNYAEIPIFICQDTHQLELRRVCILIFIHHDITKTILIVFQHIRTGTEQFHSLHDQIVKIHGIVSF